MKDADFDLLTLDQLVSILDELVDRHALGFHYAGLPCLSKARIIVRVTFRLFKHTYGELNLQYGSKYLTLQQLDVMHALPIAEDLYAAMRTVTKGHVIRHWCAVPDRCVYALSSRLLLPKGFESQVRQNSIVVIRYFQELESRELLLKRIQANDR